MKLLQNIVAPMDENTFVYFDEFTKEGVIIDPGGDADKIVELVESNNIDIKAILLTHGHGDHIGAIPKLKLKYNWPVAIHADDMYILGDSDMNFSQILGYPPIKIKPSIIFRENGSFNIGKDCIMRIIHTPGHTPGGVCYYSEKDEILFSGDTLFYSAMKRPNFPGKRTKEVVRAIQKATGKGNLPGEDMDMLIDSINNRILNCFDDKTKVFMGHGFYTTIGFEKKCNPFKKI